MFRPLAEQLAGAAAIRRGERVLELSAGDGELTTQLLAATGTSPTVVIAPVRRLAFADNAFDVAVALLAVDAGAILTPTLHELARVARRVRVLLWIDAITTTTPAPPPDAPPGWTRSVLADVARFDGIAQLWLALITERGVDVPPAEEPHVRRRIEENVARFTAADGTMRIPVRATLLSLR